MDLPEKQSGMEIRNHNATSEKTAVKGIAPLLPVLLIMMFRRHMVSSVMPGKYAETLHAILVQPSYDRFKIPHNQMLEAPAATASKR